MLLKRVVRTNWTKKKEDRYERKNGSWSDPDFGAKKFFADILSQEIKLLARQGAVRSMSR